MAKSRTFVPEPDELPRREKTELLLRTVEDAANEGTTTFATGFAIEVAGADPGVIGATTFSGRYISFGAALADLIQVLSVKINHRLRNKSTLRL